MWSRSQRRTEGFCRNAGRRFVSAMFGIAEEPLLIHLDGIYNNALNAGPTAAGLSRPALSLQSAIRLIHHHWAGIASNRRGLLFQMRSPGIGQ